MREFPLTNIINKDIKCDRAIEIQQTNTGWYIAVPNGFNGDITDMPDGIICRIKHIIGANNCSSFPSQQIYDNLGYWDADVVQFGIGDATSYLCNAIYSPTQDTALLFYGENLLISVKKHNGCVIFEVECDGPLKIYAIEDYIKKYCGHSWYKPMDRTVFKTPPAGWCSWYYYYLDITEEEIIKNTDWLEQNLKKFGCEWIQIDDGWQGVDHGSNRNWFDSEKSTFPRGMKWLADYIRSKGMRPGIWCIPFTTSRHDLFEKDPSMFIRRPDGSSVGDGNEDVPEDKFLIWPGYYHIDATSSKGQEYLKDVFTTLCHKWGYDYVKIDATAFVIPVHQKYSHSLENRSIHAEQMYRKSIEIIKGTMGKDKFLLNCACGLGFRPSFGLIDALRIGGDVNISWESIQEAFKNTMESVYLNKTALYTDPDVVCVREPLTYDNAKAWCTILGLTGQLLMTSDKMYDLPDERVELLRRIFPVADIHPMELYSINYEKLPQILDLKVALKNIESWDVVSAFNWSNEEELNLTLSPKKLGLSEGQYICTDAWSGELLGHKDGVLDISIVPASCRVVTYWQYKERPQLVGTNRHLTQGAVDIEQLNWDNDNLILSGTSNVVGGDTYIIRVYVPEGYEVMEKDVRTVRKMAYKSINSDENRSVNWEIKFRYTI